MKALGFKHLNSDAGIFVCWEGPNLILAVVYVYNAIFISRNKKLTNEKKGSLHGQVGMPRSGALPRDRNEIVLHGDTKFHFLSIQQNPVLITAGAVRIIGADYTSWLKLEMQ